MAADPQSASLCSDVWADVARIAVNSLAPVASPQAQQDVGLRTNLTVEAGKEAAFVDVKSVDGTTRVTQQELKDAIEAAVRKIIGQSPVWVFQIGSSASDAVVRKVVERLPSLVEARRQKLTEKSIEALVDAYLPADALAPVLPDIEADNARAQADFLKTYPTLTADQVAERAGHRAANRGATANRWKADRKIFAVRAGGREAYPAFQFKDGRPRATLRSALQALDGRSGWQTAFWFITPNSWLGGVSPIDRLADGEALAAAAAHEAEAWAG